jgi:uncharacterized protein YggE
MFNTPEGAKVLKYGSVVLIVLAVFLAIQSIYSLVATRNIGKQDPYMNTITVNGTAERLATPDLATFSFGAEATAESVAAAQKVVTDRVNKALDIIRAAGVEEKDIKTVGYNINPHYEYNQGVCTPYNCPPGRQTLVGYDVSQMIEVKVRDTSKAGEILGKLGGAEVTNLSGLSFTIDDEEKILAEARAEAIKDAREKAKVLAKDLGVRLGDVVSFNDNDYYPMPYYGGMYGKEMDVAMPENAAPRVPTGENTITSNVSITYKIR